MVSESRASFNGKTNILEFVSVFMAALVIGVILSLLGLAVGTAAPSSALLYTEATQFDSGLRIGTGGPEPCERTGATGSVARWERY
jgi:hypothetical protein